MQISFKTAKEKQSLLFPCAGVSSKRWKELLEKSSPLELKPEPAQTKTVERMPRREMQVVFDGIDNMDRRFSEPFVKSLIPMIAALHPEDAIEILQRGIISENESSKSLFARKIAKERFEENPGLLEAALRSRNLHIYAKARSRIRFLPDAKRAEMETAASEADLSQKYIMPAFISVWHFEHTFEALRALLKSGEIAPLEEVCRNIVAHNIDNKHLAEGEFSMLVRHCVKKLMPYAKEASRITFFQKVDSSIRYSFAVLFALSPIIIPNIVLGFTPESLSYLPWCLFTFIAALIPAGYIPGVRINFEGKKHKVSDAKSKLWDTMAQGL